MRRFALSLSTAALVLFAVSIADSLVAHTNDVPPQPIDCIYCGVRTTVHRMENTQEYVFHCPRCRALLIDPR